MQHILYEIAPAIFACVLLFLCIKFFKHKKQEAKTETRRAGDKNKNRDGRDLKR